MFSCFTLVLTIHTITPFSQGPVQLRISSCHCHSTYVHRTQTQNQQRPSSITMETTYRHIHCTGINTSLNSTLFTESVLFFHCYLYYFELQCAAMRIFFHSTLFVAVAISTTILLIQDQHFSPSNYCVLRWLRNSSNYGNIIFIAYMEILLN